MVGASRVVRAIMVTATIIICTMTTTTKVADVRQRRRCFARGMGRGEKNIFLPPFQPILLCVLYVIPPILTTRSQTPPWSGSDGPGGGEDEHERGIEMTKNKVQIHLILF